MKVPARNKILRLTIPVQAKLESVIDTKHPLLQISRGSNLSEKLLFAWRREQGYIYFFDREHLPGILSQIPESEQEYYDKQLQFLIDWVRGKPMPEHDKSKPFPQGLIPFKKSQPFWYCNQETNQELVCWTNRFAWLPGIALAACRRKEKIASEAIFRLIDNWIASCPVPVRLIEWKERPWKYWYHPWAPLNTALRATNWMMTLHILWDSPALNPERFARLVLCFRQHLIYLACVSPRLDKGAKGNHFLMEMEGLLNASLFPWMQESHRGREIALSNLVRCVNNQILPDGVHIERAPGYHRGCAVWFAMPLILARLNKWEVPEEVYYRVAKMLYFSLQCVAPDGTETKSGDNSACRDGWHREQLLARLTCQKLPVSGLKPAGLVCLVKNLPVITYRRGTSQVFPLATHFKYGGFAVARSSWKNKASYIFMKLDGYGGGHSHADFLSFNFVWKGHLVIDERGMWSYDDDWKAISCRLACSHNVLLLGRRDMFEQKLDEMRNWARRPPIVKVTEVVCNIKEGKGMIAGGKVRWRDGAWWKRRVDFVYDYGVTVIDSFYQPVSDEVAVQFYIRGDRLILENDKVFVLDRNKKIVQISFETDLPSGKTEVTTTEVYERWYTSVPAYLVRFILPCAERGTITTKIAGIESNGES
jgi:hypothetical protein